MIELLTRAALGLFVISGAVRVDAQPLLGRSPVRVVVVGTEVPEFAGRLESPAFSVRRSATVTADDVAWGHALWLASTPKPESHAAISEAVRGGLGVLAGPDALEAATSSEALRSLFGIAPPEDTPAPTNGDAPGRDGGKETQSEKRAASGPVDGIIAVEQQNHSITQSVTHFLHRSSSYRVSREARCDVLATAFPVGDSPGNDARRPALWTRRHGRGVVVAMGMASGTGDSPGLAETLALRALEWSSQRRVTTKLEGKYRLLASALVASDEEFARSLGSEKGFFRGRQIAPVMSYVGAPWLTRPEREQEEDPARLLEILRIRPGDTVADIGCGNGYFALRIARKIGPKGRVIGVDIQPEMLELLRKRASRQEIENVSTVLCTETDPKLEPGTVDLAIMVDVYHELAKPTPVMHALRRALKPGGRVALVEYRGEDPSVPIKPLHRMTVAQAEAEMAALGFEKVEFDTRSLPVQHVLVFGKRRATEAKTESPRPSPDSGNERR